MPSGSLSCWRCWVVLSLQSQLKSAAPSRQWLGQQHLDLDTGWERGKAIRFSGRVRVRLITHHAWGNLVPMAQMWAVSGAGQNQSLSQE